MTINKEFRPRSNINRFYVPRSKERRGRLSCKSCILTEEKSLRWYIKHRVEPVLVAVKNKTINIGDVVSPIVYKETERYRVYISWKGEIVHGQYLRDLVGKDGVQSWRWIWLNDSDVKGCLDL